MKYMIGPNGSFISEDELYHHGVKGMRWGVRRSKEQLGNRVAKLQRKTDKLNTKVKRLDSDARNYEIKSARMQSRNSKYETRITKASAKKAKYDLKYQKQAIKGNVDKMAKYAAKSAKYDAKINKATKKLKFNKWAVKASDTKAAAEKARIKIEKNERISSMYSNTIKGLDNGTIEQGRLFMQYVRD